MDTYKPKKTRIVMATFGSLGDLHPYIALGLEMKRRNVDPVIATSEVYREKVEQAGIRFAPVRPRMPELDSPEAVELIDRIFDPKTGAQFLIKELIAPSIRDSYYDLYKAVVGADLLITHPMTLAGPIVAQATRIPWVSTVLAPASLWSDHDPVVPPNAPLLGQLMRSGGPKITALIRKGIQMLMNGWIEPVYALRRELGLAPGDHPLFSGQFSPRLNLALFSAVMYQRPADVPAHTTVTGFPFYDGGRTATLSTELSEFLDRGSAPVVFTLGSSAVHVAGDFFRESIAAASIAKVRAVFLVGSERAMPKAPLPDGMIAAPYAPFGDLLPRASAVVHQGGAGTTGQALKAGVPMVVVPFNYDQHDNAARLQRLGVGLTIERKRYEGGTVAQSLSRLLSQPAYMERAFRVGELVRSEDGTVRAVDEILSTIKGSTNTGGIPAAAPVL